MARVRLEAGLGGYWTADGGCDKATVSAAFAKQLAKNGTEIMEYETWRDAVLADGTTEPLISGYCIADIVLTSDKSW